MLLDEWKVFWRFGGAKLLTGVTGVTWSLRVVFRAQFIIVAGLTVEDGASVPELSSRERGPRSVSSVPMRTALGRNLMAVGSVGTASSSPVSLPWLNFAGKDVLVSFSLDLELDSKLLLWSTVLCGKLPNFAEVGADNVRR